MTADIVAPSSSAGSSAAGSSAGESATLGPAARPSALGQWWALSSRLIRTMLLRGELLVAALAPLVFTLGFYLPLRHVMQMSGINYAQFVMPIIVMQAVAFTAISAAQLAAGERARGFTTRMKTMPVGGWVPLCARMTACMVRSVVSLAAALTYGYMIGFRFQAGLGQAALFCLAALGIGLALSLGGDAIGNLSKSPEATAQALTLPQLILGMLSCGFVPEDGFPEWIRPFVRNQPISQFAYAMRDMAEGGITFSVLLPAALWFAGLVLVFAPLAVWASMRRT